MQSATGLLPLVFLLGFAVVGVFLATLALIWVAVWRAARRGDAASRPPPLPPPKPPRRAGGLPTRRRLLVLALIGGAGGVVVGGALSLLVARQGAESRPTGVGRVGAGGDTP